MSSPAANSGQAQSPSAAGIAGPMRILLLALTGIIFLMGGVAIGLVLQKMQGTRSSHAADHADEDSSQAQGEGSGHLEELPDQEPEVAAHSTGPSESEHSIEGGPDDAHSSEGHAASGVASDQQATESAANSARAAAQPAPLAAAFSAMPELPAGQPAERLAQADKFLMVGNYQGAHEACLLLAAKFPAFQPAEVRLRLALCEEVLGDHKQAQSDYRLVVELLPALELRDAALLGQARIWCLAGRSELACATLYHALLSGTRQTSAMTGGQIAHELGVLLAQRVTTGSQRTNRLDSDYQDDFLVSPVLKVEPFQIISELAEMPLTPAEKRHIPANDISVVERFSQAPEEIFMNVRSERMNVLELVRRAANRTGLTVRITEDARLRLQEHSTQPDIVNVPLAIVFDAILEPFDTVWRVEQGALLIQLAKNAGAEEIDQYRLQSAQRTLRFACRTAPGHRWAAASSLELARLSACSGTLEDASRYLSGMLEQFPRSEFGPVGWFNLGKIELRRGRAESAIKAFHRAADLLTGHPMESLSYLYAGRIQMENDNPREAIAPLTRALVLADGTNYEAMATLQLASAYLMLEHYQRANEILVEHKASLLASSRQDQAAFLSSLIQYRSTKEVHEKFRAGTAVLGSLTNLDPFKCFGGHWPWLAGSAYHEFGMKQQEIKVLSTVLESPYAYPLQSRAQLLLLKDDPQRLTQVQPTLVKPPEFGKVPGLYFKTRLTEAATAAQQGQTEFALKLSRELAGHPKISEEERREALRLMGRIYQSQGEHERAVQCFSGIIPDQNSAQVPPTAALPIPSQGVQ